jgi:hypothetical protein
MEFGTSGMLNEGTNALHSCLLFIKLQLTYGTDGIHIDMDRLKKGEVKYVSAERHFEFVC